MIKLLNKGKMRFREKNMTGHRVIYILLICTLVSVSVSVNGQTDKKYIRKGNREYEKNKFPESEISYRKAIDKNKQSADAEFNVGTSLYKQNKFDDAGKQFMENINMQENSNKKSAALYNMGNSLLKSKKLKESIEAYKGSLKLKPDNREAKYNLAYAQDLLKKQEEQQRQQQQNNQDKKDEDKNKNKDNSKDQKDNQEKKPEDNKDKSGQDQQKDGDNKQQDQQQKQGMSKDDAQRLLNAIANDEKNVQEKVKLAKASKAKVRTVKNW
jgi:Ca-activated chloride channel homolog